jgi:hypothetical protein
MAESWLRALQVSDNPLAGSVVILLASSGLVDERFQTDSWSVAEYETVGQAAGMLTAAQSPPQVAEIVGD